MKSAEIRRQFLHFFQERAHDIVASAPIVVKNDPTLLFTNAGMNQFKDFFLGNRTPPSPRIADTQKCLRVSGKHNDLEEVGVDTYHHTMFEMLGNWSFGDYFKKEAIAWAWELLTSVYGLSPDQLYVTVFAGDASEGLARDEEAAAEWTKLVAPERILNGSKKNNFWEMGDTGPCGPCSEIHVDCRPDSERAAVDGKTLVNADHPQVIEIWNIVFMQFNRLKDGTLQPLPARHVDTGMGFERLVRVIQGKQSNYDTDVFAPTIAATEQLTGKKYDYGSGRAAIAFRVIADHLRAIVFTIADGQLPSNTGAGYVIRRILRRAVRYYYTALGFRQPLLNQLVPVVAEQFNEVFPEVQAQADFLTRVIREEEESFLRTLEKGLKRIDDIIAETLSANHSNKRISGKDAFELFDTYGFPVDLTRLIAAENQLAVDEAEFEAEMQAQKNRSRTATAIDSDDWITVHESNEPGFVGYEHLEAESHIVKYRKVKSKGREQYQLVLDRTPFYAESGGQVGDTGTIMVGGQTLAVTDTKKENHLIIHFVDQIPADMSGVAVATVDAGRRRQIMSNHTATHLLHAALRTVLGRHVAQKGSLVSPDVLRFDFSHFSKMTGEELRSVERIVNEKIRDNVPVVIREMAKDEAIALGATALFGEKYGDIVRVVIADPNYSIELCGGTHVASTGSIGTFAIISESAVAAGVRRIEALTSAAAVEYFTNRSEQYQAIAELLKTKEPLRGIERLMEERSMLERRIESLEARTLVQVRNELLAKDEIVNGVTFVGDIVEVSHADALKKLCFDLKNKLHDYVVVLCANIGGKPAVAIGISETVVVARQLDASRIIKQTVAPLIRGGGGGQPSLATAGGQDPSNLSGVIQAVRALL